MRTWCSLLLGRLACLGCPGVADAAGARLLFGAGSSASSGRPPASVSAAHGLTVALERIQACRMPVGGDVLTRSLLRLTLAGERLSPWVALACIAMGISMLVS